MLHVLLLQYDVRVIYCMQWYTLKYYTSLSTLTSYYRHDITAVYDDFNNSITGTRTLNISKLTTEKQQQCITRTATIGSNSLLLLISVSLLLPPTAYCY